MTSHETIGSNMGGLGRITTPMLSLSLWLGTCRTGRTSVSPNQFTLFQSVSHISLRWFETGMNRFNNQFRNSHIREQGRGGQTRAWISVTVSNTIFGTVHDSPWDTNQSRLCHKVCCMRHWWNAHCFNDFRITTRRYDCFWTTHIDSQNGSWFDVWNASTLLWDVLLFAVCFTKQFMEQTADQNARWSYYQKPESLLVVLKRVGRVPVAFWKKGRVPARVLSAFWSGWVSNRDF